MTRCPRGRHALLTIAATAALVVVPHAAALDGAPLSGVEDYLAAFAAAYRPSAYDQMLLGDAQAAVERAAFTMSPDITFEQELEWLAYQDLAAELSTTLRIPLYDSRAALDATLADLDLRAAEHGATAARTAATLAFFIDLATFATLTEAEARVTATLARYSAAPWLTDPAFEPLTLEQQDRPLYEAHLRLLDMHTFLAEQLGDLRSRLAATLGMADALTEPPLLDDVRRAVPPAPDQDACLEHAQETDAARLRHARARAASLISDQTAFRLELSGSAAFGFGGARSQFASAAAGPVTAVQAAAFPAALFPTAPVATIALHASLALPRGRPFGPNVEASASASASPSGASQSVRIAWPRPPLAEPVDEDPSVVLADELEQIGTGLRAMRRAVTQAGSERARLERALAWLALDDGVMQGARAMVGWPHQDTAPAVAMQAIDLGAQLAFAELEELAARAQLAVACGLRL